MTSDLPMVACSWLLLMTALRGAARGVASIGGVAGVLITDFSGSGTDLGLVLGELAGFHMESTSFRISSQGRAQPTPLRACWYGHRYFGISQVGPRHVRNQTPLMT